MSLTNINSIINRILLILEPSDIPFYEGLVTGLLNQHTKESLKSIVTLLAKVIHEDTLEQLNDAINSLIYTYDKETKYIETILPSLPVLSYNKLIKMRANDTCGLKSNSNSEGFYDRIADLIKQRLSDKLIDPYLAGFAKQLILNEVTNKKLVDEVINYLGRKDNTCPYLISNGETLQPITEEEPLKNLRIIINDVLQCAEPGDRLLLLDAINDLLDNFSKESLNEVINVLNDSFPRSKVKPAIDAIKELIYILNSNINPMKFYKKRFYNPANDTTSNATNTFFWFTAHLEDNLLDQYLLMHVRVALFKKYNIHLNTRLIKEHEQSNEIIQFIHDVTLDYFKQHPETVLIM